MTERSRVSAVSEVNLMLENIRKLQEGGATREVVGSHVANCNEWLRTIAPGIEAALAGSSRYEAADLFAAKHLLEAFLLGFTIASNLD